MKEGELVRLTQEDFPNGISMLFLSDVHKREFIPSPIVGEPVSGYIFFKITSKMQPNSIPIIARQALTESIEKEKEYTKNRLKVANAFILHSGPYQEGKDQEASIRFYKVQLPEYLFQ